MGRVERVRRPEIADLMLLVTVVIWSLNFTVTKYVLNHGFKPLAYTAIRFGTAALLFIGFTWVREHSFRLQRRDIPFILGAATVGIFQLGRVHLRHEADDCGNRRPDLRDDADPDRALRRRQWDRAATQPFLAGRSNFV